MRIDDLRDLIGRRLQATPSLIELPRLPKHSAASFEFIPSFTMPFMGIVALPFVGSEILSGSPEELEGISAGKAMSHTLDATEDDSARSRQQRTGIGLSRSLTAAAVAGAMGAAVVMGTSSGATAQLRTQSVKSTQPPVLVRASSDTLGNSQDSLSMGVSNWLQMGLEKLEQFRQLPDNWDGYGAQTPNSTAISRSETALRTLSHMAFEPSGIVPSAENGVAIVFQDENRYADIEFFNSGEIFVGLTPPEGEPIVIEVGADQSEIAAALEKIRGFFHG